jgi:hypothetical protein
MSVFVSYFLIRQMFFVVIILSKPSVLLVIKFDASCLPVHAKILFPRFVHTYIIKSKIFDIAEKVAASANPDQESTEHREVISTLLHGAPAIQQQVLSSEHRQHCALMMGKTPAGAHYYSLIAGAMFIIAQEPLLCSNNGDDSHQSTILCVLRQWAGIVYRNRALQ